MSDDGAAPPPPPSEGDNDVGMDDAAAPPAAPEAPAYDETTPLTPAGDRTMRVRKTCMKMLKQRGYNVDQDEMAMTKGGFRHKFGDPPRRGDLTMMTQHTDDQVSRSRRRRASRRPAPPPRLTPSLPNPSRTTTSSSSSRPRPSSGSSPSPCTATA